MIYGDENVEKIQLIQHYRNDRIKVPNLQKNENILARPLFAKQHHNIENKQKVKKKTYSEWIL